MRLVHLKPHYLIILSLVIIWLAYRSILPCGLFDMVLRYSGCVKEIRVSGIASGVVFSPDSRFLAISESFSDSDSNKKNPGVEIWTTTSWQKLYSVLGPITSVAFSPTESTFAIGSIEGNSYYSPPGINIHKTNTGEITRRVGAKTGRSVELEFSPNGQLLTEVGHYFPIRVFSLLDNTQVYTIPTHRFTRGLELSPDGQFLASTDGGLVIHLRRAPAGELLHTFEGEGLGGIGYGGVTFSNDGQFMASGNYWGEIYIWQVNDGHLVSKFKANSGWIEDLEFSPTSNILATSGGNAVLKLWHIPEGELLHKVNLGGGYNGRILSVDFSDDGKWLAVSQRFDRIKIFDISGW